MLFRSRRRGRIHEIAPDEIFLDASNLPGLESSQFEGRVESPISRRSLFSVGLVFALVGLVFAGRAFSLQVAHGDSYAQISRNNTLDRSLVFATRGVIYDRNGKELAWNEAQPATSTASAAAQDESGDRFALRRYTPLPGFSHVLGFVQYPKADKTGTWWREEYVGSSGAELAFDKELSGTNGWRMIEADAHGVVQRTNILVPPEHGKDLRLSIDADVQSTLYAMLSEHARKQSFRGGAVVIMDVWTGELLALTSFPQYDDNAFTVGDRDAIRAANEDSRTPLLNRAISGLYAPGSIVKPIFAAAALNEGVISPDTKILSKGALILPNPYDPAHPSIFKDWRAHGWVNMREALAVSSDEYFYTVGGGYGSQRGLGISKIDEYARLFGLGSVTGIALRGEVDGNIPTPEWKAQVFDGDPWRIGDTYHTSIGQYGFQMTPLQAVRYTAAIANGGKLLTPQLLASSTPQYADIGIPDEYLQVVREGMRMAVTFNHPNTTMRSMNIPGLRMGAKTGTAQVGAHNEYQNSWVIAFWPIERPHYAIALVLERGKMGVVTAGAGPALLPFFRWLVANHPEYLQ